MRKLSFIAFWLQFKFTIFKALEGHSTIATNRNTENQINFFIFFSRFYFELIQFKSIVIHLFQFSIHFRFNQVLKEMVVFDMSRSQHKRWIWATFYRISIVVQQIATAHPSRVVNKMCRQWHHNSHQHHYHHHHHPHIRRQPRRHRSHHRRVHRQPCHRRQIKSKSSTINWTMSIIVINRPIVRRIIIMAIAFEPIPMRIIMMPMMEMIMFHIFLRCIIINRHHQWKYAVSVCPRQLMPHIQQTSSSIQMAVVAKDLAAGAITMIIFQNNNTKPVKSSLRQRCRISVKRLSQRRQQRQPKHHRSKPIRPQTKA